MLCVIGSEIYKYTLAQASRLYLTEVHREVKGDTFFPEFNRNEWHEVIRESFEADEENDFDFSFILLERN